MRLRLELQVGPLLVVFDPFPEEEEDEPFQAVTSVDAGTERQDGYGTPELHIGFRSGYYED